MYEKALLDMGFFKYHKLENSPYIKSLPKSNLNVIISSDIEGNIYKEQSEFFITIQNSDVMKNILLFFSDAQDREDWDWTSKFIHKSKNILDTIKFIKFLDDLDGLISLTPLSNMYAICLKDDFCILPNFTLNNNGIFNIHSKDEHNNLNFDTIQFGNLKTNVFTYYNLEKDLIFIKDFLIDKERYTIN